MTAARWAGRWSVRLLAAYGLGTLVAVAIGRTDW